MEIEQINPKKPNFGLVVGLACLVMLAFLAAACFFLKYDGKHLMLRHPHAEPNARLVVPAIRAGSAVALALGVS